MVLSTLTRKTTHADVHTHAYTRARTGRSGVHDVHALPV